MYFVLAENVRYQTINSVYRGNTAPAPPVPPAPPAPPAPRAPPPTRAVESIEMGHVPTVQPGGNDATPSCCNNTLILAKIWKPILVVVVILVVILVAVVLYLSISKVRRLFCISD